MNDSNPAFKLNPLLSTWLQFNDGEVLVQTGKVELGQGISTALAMIVSEELDCDISRIRIQTGRTDRGPNEFLTAGSLSIEGSGGALRQASAEARQIFLTRAAARFTVPLGALVVTDGVICNPQGNEQISYWSLLDGGQLDVEVTGTFTAKRPDELKLVGGTIQRLDLFDKITGGVAFIQDINLPGMHHARVVRPRHVLSELMEIDARIVDTLDEGVRVVRDGNFLAVIARSESAAINAKQKLARAARWRPPPGDVPADLKSYLRQPAYSLLVEDGTPTDTPLPAPKTERSGEQRRSATYFKPYHLHGSMSPSAAIATFANHRLEIVSHTQGPAIAQREIARVLGLAVEQVAVVHKENAGCYGHNGADDAAMDAALLAFHHPDTPIHLKWDREDEHLHEPMSPAMLVDLSADLKEGQICYWRADVFSQTHMNRPMPGATDVSRLMAAWQKEQPLAVQQPQPSRAPHGGIHRNADPYYVLPEKRITKNLVSDTWLRTSATRALGAFANVFAIESFMDELADEAGIDPVVFRLKHLDDARAKAVVDRLAHEMAGYRPQVLAGERVGQGMAFARYKNEKTYAAVGVFVGVHEETFAVRLDHAVVVADAGRVIDRDGLANQLEGGFVQAASWALKEQVRFDASGSISSNWDTYPILTFSEVPTVATVVLDQPHLPSLGAGEATTGPTPAAIANALFNATGIRIREMPFLPDELRRVALSQWQG